MKFLLTLLVAGALFALPAAETKSSRKTAGTAKSPNSGAPPADAKKQADGSYTSTDASGKHWIHRQTPFGWARYEEQSASAPANSKAEPDPTRVVEDLGDRVKFEKPGPFGMARWERKKSELTAGERAVLDKHHATEPRPSGSGGAVRSRDR
ncbi:MAG: hypothetical protein ACKV22_06590 [Bryobacteraceae bacterium]